MPGIHRHSSISRRTDRWMLRSWSCTGTTPRSARCSFGHLSADAQSTSPILKVSALMEIVSCVSSYVSSGGKIFKQLIGGITTPLFDQPTLICLDATPKLKKGQCIRELLLI